MWWCVFYKAFFSTPLHRNPLVNLGRTPPPPRFLRRHHAVTSLICGREHHKLSRPRNRGSTADTPQ